MPGVKSSALEFLGELSTSVFIARVVSGVAEELCGLRPTASLSGDDFAADFNTMGVKEAATEGGPEPSGGGGVSCSLSISLNAFSLASVFAISVSSSKSSSAARRACFRLSIDLSAFSSARRTLSRSLADNLELALDDRSDPLLLLPSS